MILRNGTIFDAVNPQSYTADIAVRDGKIAAIGQNLPAEAGEEILISFCIITLVTKV